MGDTDDMDDKRIEKILEVQSLYREKHHQEELRVQRLESRVDALEKSITKIDGNLGRAVWIVVTTVITSVLGFFFGGGLK